MPVNLDTSAVGGIIGGLIPAAAIGAGWAIRTIIKHRKAVARGLVAGFDIKSEAGDNSEQEDKLNAVIMEFLRRQEADRQEEARQRDRQWEMIGQCVKECREHSANLLAVVNSIQNMALYMDSTHKHQSEALKSTADNVINLSGYLYRRLGDGQDNGWTRPPRASGGGN